MKRFSPAAERNRGPIAEALADVLPATGLVLEVASGTGQHAAALGAAFPALTWQPSERSEADFPSIEAWSREARVANVRAPVALDVTSETWPIDHCDAILVCNMIHIAPFTACEGLMRGAAALLSAGAPLCLYGPFFLPGVATAPSNLAFDESLRSRDPSWGIRSLEEVDAEAAGRGFQREALRALPANNVLVVYRRKAAE